MLAQESHLRFERSYTEDSISSICTNYESDDY